MLQNVATETERSEAFEARLSAMRLAGPVDAPHIIDGSTSFEGPELHREDPTNPSRYVSVCHDAPADVVSRAVSAARRASRAWARKSPYERASVLRRVDTLLTPERRVDIAAIISLEVAKSRLEAFVEVDELSTLIERYCSIAERSGAFETILTQNRDDLVSRSQIRPFGVFAVIAPFNYPMVQGAGPAIAALLAGNTVVMKPSHLGPRSAQAFVDLLHEAGLPAGVINLVHGADEPGKALVGEDIDGVAFTGSVEAGRSIHEVMTSGPYRRPVIAELGGKNVAVVTDSADVDLAARSIATSAFGLSGQRCSALSRVIATPGVYDDLVTRLGDLTAALVVGDPADSKTFAGPVVERASVERFAESVKVAQADGRVVTGGATRPVDEGYYVDLTIVADLPLGHPLTREELFVPLVTVTVAPSFEDALAEANVVPYGLTAGIYTRDVEEARVFVESIEAGGVNVNSPVGATTGFWPGNQTFGGWKASGTTGKLAFGDFYIQQFGREQCTNVASDLLL